MKLRERGCVKSSDLHGTGSQSPKPLPELRCCPICIGESEHLLRSEVSSGYSMGNAVRDGSGLSAAGSGNDPDRASKCGGGLKLLGIKRAEDVTSTLSVQFES